jgi:hypothetical protein
MISESIHVAAQDGQKDAVAALLANVAKVDVRDGDGRTPLHLAAIHGRTDVAELLLHRGADVNARDKGGETPLHYAAFMGHMDLLRLLMANRADVNAKDKDSETAMQLAKSEGHTNIVDLLHLSDLETVNEENLPSIRAIARYSAIQRSIWSLASWGCINIAAWWFIFADDWRTLLGKLGNPGGPGIYFLSYAGLIIGCVMLVFAAIGILSRLRFIIALDGLSLIGIGIWNLISGPLEEDWLLSPHGYHLMDGPEKVWILLGISQILWGISRISSFNRVRKWYCSDANSQELNELRGKLHSFVQLPENAKTCVLKACITTGWIPFLERKVHYTGRLLDKKIIFISNRLDDCLETKQEAMHTAIFSEFSVKMDVGGSVKTLRLGSASPEMLQQWRLKALKEAPLTSEAIQRVKNHATLGVAFILLSLIMFLFGFAGNDVGKILQILGLLLFLSGIWIVTKSGRKLNNAKTGNADKV